MYFYHKFLSHNCRQTIPPVWSSLRSGRTDLYEASSTLDSVDLHHLKSQHCNSLQRKWLKYVPVKWLYFAPKCSCCQCWCSLAFCCQFLNLPSLHRRMSIVLFTPQLLQIFLRQHLQPTLVILSSFLVSQKKNLLPSPLCVLCQHPACLSPPVSWWTSLAACQSSLAVYNQSEFICLHPLLFSCLCSLLNKLIPVSCASYSGARWPSPFTSTPLSDSQIKFPISFHLSQSLWVCF